MSKMERTLLCLAHMSGHEMKYIQEAFATNWVVPLGPNVNAFEEGLQRFSASRSVRYAWLHEDYPASIQPHVEEAEGLWHDGYPHLQTKRVVALSSGTAAVHLALVALGVGQGDEVICQSFTFCASSHPVTYQGATPVFVDSEEETWNMDPALLEQAIEDRIKKTGRKPKAIIVVYLYGMPARINEILAVADKYDIPVVEDAAEGLGSRYDGQVCGTFGQFGVLSFNGNKMITTSGGGALVCPNETTAQRVMFFATQAREAFPYYQHEHIGYNYRMSNICAGIGRGQLTVLEEHVEHHRRLAHRYAELLRDVNGVDFHTGGDAEIENNPTKRDVHQIRSNFWLNTIILHPDLKVRGQENAYVHAVQGAIGGAAGYVHQSGQVHTTLEPNTNVEAMRMALDEAGIESRPLWKPMHVQPVYAASPAYTNGVSEKLFQQGLCLPSGPMVSEQDVERIVEIIRANILT